jgi:hypothetical protein
MFLDLLNDLLNDGGYPGVEGADIYRGSINPESSDQTDLKQQRRCKP